MTLLGLSKGGFFGLGVMALPLMSLFVPPLQAAAILLPTVIAQDVLTIWTYRRTWSAWNLKVMLPSMAVGHRASAAVCGLAVAAPYPAGDRAHRRAVRAAALARPALRAAAFTPNAFTGIFFGAIGGFTTLLANAGGPAWQMHFLPQRLDKLTYVGTLTMLFALSNVIKVPAFGALGQLTCGEPAVRRVPACRSRSRRTMRGIWLVRRTSTELFFRIAYVLMFVIAIELIRSSLVELWWP